MSRPATTKRAGTQSSTAALGAAAGLAAGSPIVSMTLSNDNESSTHDQSPCIMYCFTLSDSRRSRCTRQPSAHRVRPMPLDPQASDGRGLWLPPVSMTLAWAPRQFSTPIRQERIFCSCFSQTVCDPFGKCYHCLMATMDADTIREWIAAAEVDVTRLAAEAERSQHRLAQARAQLRLMYELLATVTHEEVARKPEALGGEKSVRERVAEAVLGILRECGRPMRLTDIHAEFLRRELPLPGSGTPANIASHLIDRTVFTRPSRGTFGLAEWGGESGPMSSTPRRSAARRKRRTAHP